MGLAKESHHESGHGWKCGRGQRSKIKVMTTWPIMAEEYISSAWRRGSVVVFFFIFLFISFYVLVLFLCQFHISLWCCVAHLTRKIVECTKYLHVVSYRFYRAYRTYPINVSPRASIPFIFIFIRQKSSSNTHKNKQTKGKCKHTYNIIMQIEKTRLYCRYNSKYWQDIS